jgi:hypothetical protein
VKDRYCSREGCCCCCYYCSEIEFLARIHCQSVLPWRNSSPAQQCSHHQHHQLAHVSQVEQRGCWDGHHPPTPRGFWQKGTTSSSEHWGRQVCRRKVSTHVDSMQLLHAISCVTAIQRTLPPQQFLGICPYFLRRVRLVVFLCVPQNIFFNKLIFTKLGMSVIQCETYAMCNSLPSTHEQ